MKRIALIYFDETGTHIIAPEETETINNKKHKIMRTLNQTKIEAALLTLTASLLTIMFILFNNF